MIGRSSVVLTRPGTRAGLGSSTSGSLSTPCVASWSGSPLHVGANLQPFDTALFPVLVLGAVTSAVLVSLGLFAFFRRQSRSYLLVVLALAPLDEQADGSK